MGRGRYYIDRLTIDIQEKIEDIPDLNRLRWVYNTSYMYAYISYIYPYPLSGVGGGD